MNNLTGIELEKLVFDKFVEAGWDVKVDRGATISPDMEIFYDGKNYGVVETYLSKRGNPKFLLDKIDKIKAMLKIIGKDPILLILTDGFEYHISEYGKPFETLHFVPSPTSFYVSNLIKDNNDVNDKEDK